MNQHPHPTEEVGRYTAVSGKASAITYAVEWCDTCKAAYKRPVMFLDGIKRTHDELTAAYQAERDDWARCVAAVRERRQAAEKAAAADASAEKGGADA